MRRLVYTRADGGTTISTPVINTIGEVDGFTEADAEARALTKVPADATNVRWVTAAEIPLDRAFRAAWKNDLTVDMAKAKAIHLDRIRALREPRLAKLDADYLRADEAGDTAQKAVIAAKKQALRDATAYPAIDAARTPDQLKAAIPPALLS